MKAYPSMIRGIRAGLAILALACFLVTACDRFDPAAPLPPPGVGPAPGLGDEGVGTITEVAVEHPVFRGLSDMVAGDGAVRLAWEAATDNFDPPAEITYRIYTAALPGEEDFTAPFAETAPGASAHEIAGLTNGELLYAVVRAVDLEGNEDANRIEWFALPNPVRFVDRATATPGIGTDPAAPFPSIAQAVSGTIALGGVNFYVAAGLYPENAFLFPGMFLYGGFTQSFDLLARDPAANLTELSIPETPLTVDVVTLLAGAAPSGVDGVQLEGNFIADNGVKAKDTRIRVSKCGVRHAVAHGIELTSDAIDEKLIEGFVRGCAIVENGSEGIFLSGLPDLDLDDNLVRANGNEGIESQWIFAEAATTSRLDITRNRVEGNADEGIDLDIAEVSETDSTLSQGARVRIAIRNNILADNGGAGVQTDLDFENSDGIDCRVRIEDNRISANALGGVLLDGDAAGSFRIARNAISANGTVGIGVAGSSAGPVVRVLHSRLLGNRGDGIAVTGHASVDLRHSVVRGHPGHAVRAPLAHVQIANSVLADNGEAGDPTRARYSIIAPALAGTAAGLGVFIADPAFELHPILFDQVPSDGSGAGIPVNDPSDWQPGDVAELRDDGKALRVTQVLGDRIVVDPAPATAARAGDTLFGFRGAAIATESEFLQEASPAIDAGDTLERDRDGTLPDLGPRGGDTPGNVGVETALAAEVAPLEPIAISPQAGFLQTEGKWRFTFNRPLPAAIAGNLEVYQHGISVSHFCNRIVSGADLEIISSLAFTPGGRLTVELVPLESAIAEDRQSAHIFIDTTFAAAVPDADAGAAGANDTPAAAQPIAVTAALIDGAITSPTDLDYYSATIAAGATLDVELIAGSIESPLAGRVTLLKADGTTVIATATAAPPTLLDPTLPPYRSDAGETVVILVDAASASGAPGHTYRLALHVHK